MGHRYPWSSFLTSAYVSLSLPFLLVPDSETNCLATTPPPPLSSLLIAAGHVSISLSHWMLLGAFSKFGDGVDGGPAGCLVT